MHTLNRRRLLRYLASGVAAALASPGLLAAQAAPLPVTVTIYKDPTCGCCEAWAGHLRVNGFSPKVVTRPDLRSIKTQYGVPRELESCHTASVDGYVIEGHVPAAAIRRLLRERPDVVGLAVPGMPIGSPGMESRDYSPQRYEVLTFDRKGRTAVFERH